MTFIQPFASPEVDLERMWLCAFMSAIIIAHHLMFFSPPARFISPLVLLSHFFFLFVFFFSLLPSLSPSLCCTAVGRKCKSSGTIFFSGVLISADDVSKEVKGTTQRPLQLLSPIHCVQIYVPPPTSPHPHHHHHLSLFFPLFLCHSCSLSNYIFNIINIDWAVHLEPLFNNWLLQLI